MRSILITGAASGIGAGIALELGRAGHHIIVSDLNPDAAGEVARQIREAGGSAEAVALDVTSDESVAAALAAISRPVEVLVNNAGLQHVARLEEFPMARWDFLVQVMLTGVARLTRAVLPGMRERGFGRIINISSINGQKGQMGQTNYAAAKAGVIGFTKALALENAAKGVTVNCICPGYIDTDMVAAVPEDVLKKIIAGIPVGRLGRAEEIAAAVVYLASDAAGFATGSVMTINGGQYMANG